MAEENKEFKYIVRLAATDIDGNKPTLYGLTYIKGINYMTANAIVTYAGVDGKKRIGNLSDEEIEKLGKAIETMNEWLPPWMRNRRRDLYTGKDLHLIGTEIDLAKREDINLSRKIRAYRGIRHERGLPVRGQRTRSNKRSGLTVGVIKKRR
ncbi:MAG: 30S ribosomal protein S13 [Thermoplasmata archaeon]|nr:MAG: 30S ribosomal protein S13 [Thermoplasmata archaeon]